MAAFIPHTLLSTYTQHSELVLALGFIDQPPKIILVYSWPHSTNKILNGNIAGRWSIQYHNQMYLHKMMKIHIAEMVGCGQMARYEYGQQETSVISAMQAM